MDPFELFSKSQSLFKDLFTIAKTLGNMDLMQKLIDLQIQLADAGKALNENVGEIQHLKSLVKALDVELKLKQSMKFFEGAWWQQGDNTPFCATCWEKDQKTIHVKKAMLDKWLCPVCGRGFMPRNPPDFEKH